MTTTLPQTSTGTEDPVAIDALGPAGEYRTRNREVITDTAGVPVAELSIVPPLYVTRTIGAQRKLRPLPVAQREAALAKTAEIFTNSVAFSVYHRLLGHAIFTMLLAALAVVETRYMLP